MRLWPSIASKSIVLHVRMCPAARRGAFTLIEMLVSVSVLALLVVFVSQLTTTATQSITTASKRTDADRAARLVLDRISTDITRMVKRSDIDYSFIKHPGNDALAFVAETAGFYDLAPAPPSYSRRRATSALIAYQAAAASSALSTIDLRRLARGLVWADETEDTAAYSTLPFLPVKIVGTPGMYSNLLKLYDPENPEFKVISDQVFRFEYSFLLKNGKVSVDPWIPDAPYSHSSTTIGDVSAIIITVASLDSVSRVVAGDMMKLSFALPDAVSGSDTASRWNDVINKKDAARPFPPPSSSQLAASAVRVYQRYCYIGRN